MDQFEKPSSIFPGDEQSHEIRRSANYKPNIWKNNVLRSLPSSYHAEREYKREGNRLIKEVKNMFEEARDNNAQLLELISNISKLGLFNHFESEVREALDEIAQSISSLKNKGFSQSNDLYTTSLLFNLLRQHGYKVTQGI
ncbi:hypothetical protein Leryth_025157 [Lithospermum erythrorhizon]|nr:hypothetical protein Leryth_025157 [Lithospermum erythrorhizon]